MHLSLHHLQEAEAVRLRILGECNSALVVSEDHRCLELLVSKFSQQLS
jgi:hypothetical protein